MNKPNVFEFTDYRAFLKAQYDWEKSQHADFSHAIFSERAGLKSRSYLRLVITGKRNLSIDAITKFIVGFGLSHQEGEGFKNLVHFNQASDFESRKHYWECFLKSQPQGGKRSRRVQDEYLYLARMYHPILLVLMRQPHIQKDLESLSNMLNIKPAQVEEALKVLTELGALKQLDQNNYVVTSDGFETSNDIPNIAIQSFHKNMLTRAQESVSTLAPAEREFQSLMIPMSEDEFLYLRNRIRALMDELDQKFGGKRPQSEKVYALNINLIPITSDFIREEKSIASQKSEEKSKENLL